MTKPRKCEAFVIACPGVPWYDGTMSDMKHILVVEDEPLLALALRGALTSRAGGGYEVEISPLGSEALDRLAEKPVDLVVVDLRMPGMSGLEVIRRTRSMSPSTRTMLITAFGSRDVQEAATELSAVYLAKPFSLHEFLGVVQKMLAESPAGVPA